MKRYIKYIRASEEVDIDTSMFNGTPFVPKTGMSYYDNFLNQKDLAYMRKAKNRNGEIVMMSPNEYFEACSKYVFNHDLNSSIENLKRQRRRDTQSIEWLENQVLQGNKLNLCMINYADKGQEGLHRMMVLGDLYGWDKKYPVLVVTVDDEAWEARIKLIRECDEFKRYDFEKICKASADEICDWRSTPPSNVTEILRDEIIKEARSYEDGYDIDVQIELEEDDGEQQFVIYLTRFKTYDCEGLLNPVRLWVGDYFDIRNETPSQIDDNDLDDFDINDLFFK